MMNPTLRTGKGFYRTRNAFQEIFFHVIEIPVSVAQWEVYVIRLKVEL